jgi:hypothetical protein
VSSHVKWFFCHEVRLCASKWYSKQVCGHSRMLFVVLDSMSCAWRPLTTWRRTTPQWWYTWRMWTTTRLCLSDQPTAHRSPKRMTVTCRSVCCRSRLRWTHVADFIVRTEDLETSHWLNVEWPLAGVPPTSKFRASICSTKYWGKVFTVFPIKARDWLEVSLTFWNTLETTRTISFNVAYSHVYPEDHIKLNIFPEGGGIKAAGAWGSQPCHCMCRLTENFGSLNLLEPSRTG